MLVLGDESRRGEDVEGGWDEDPVEREYEFSEWVWVCGDGYGDWWRRQW